MPPNNNETTIGPILPIEQEQVEEELIECYFCSDQVPEEDIRVDSAGDRACTGCLSDGDIRLCWDCDEFSGDSLYSECAAHVYCYDCYHELFRHCSQCDIEQYAGDLFGVLCRTCYYEETDGGQGNIRSYHDNPSLEFISTKSDADETAIPYYLGLEIEIEADISVINKAIPEFDNLWACNDGSLDEGAEVISHPGTLNAWNDGKMINWADWDTYIHSQVPNQEEISENGIHVHISRSAFFNKRNKQSAAHVYRFLMFIQRHQSAIQFIAGRNYSSYCQWDGHRDISERVKDSKGNLEAYGERYRPVNTNNPNTLEVRIFDGRTDPTFIKQCYQFVASVAEFTRNKSVKHKLEWKEYVSFVAENRGDYSELNRFLYTEETELTERSLESKQYWDRDVASNYAKKNKEARDRKASRRRAHASSCCDYCDRYGR